MKSNGIALVLSLCISVWSFVPTAVKGQDVGRPDSVYFGAGTVRLVDCSPTFEYSIPVMAYSDAGPQLMGFAFAWQGSAYCDTIVYTSSLGLDSVAVGISIDNGNNTARVTLLCGPPEYLFSFENPSRSRQICEVRFRGGPGDSLTTFSNAESVLWVSISDSWFPLYNACSLEASFPDTIVFAPGDADCSGIVTISDAVFLINYIFSGGNAPYDANAADPDASCLVTISDAVYLINYIFAGGPGPMAACVGK